MAISQGVSKRVAYKKETNWGELPGATGAKEIRRVTATFNLTKETYESQEIRSDYQVASFSHGVRSVDGSINGELSPGTYSDFIASAVAKDFVAGLTIASVTADIAAAVGLGTKAFTVTRSTGSWITNGVRAGMLVQFTGATNPENNTNNVLVIGVSALVLTVQVLSDTMLVAESAATLAVAQPGKQTWAPLTGHTDDSYTFEEWYADIAQSEVYTGNKVGSVAMQLPSTGLVTCDITFMGKNLQQDGTVAYFTTPTAANTEGIFAAVSGAVVVNGVPRALITSADFTIDRGLEAANVVGSNFAADVFTGRIRVNGNISTYFSDGQFRDYFNDETEISLVFALTNGTEKDAAAMTFAMPRVKLGSDGKQDGEMGITRDHSFVALLKENDTTIYVQDTTL